MSDMNHLLSGTIPASPGSGPGSGFEAGLDAMADLIMLSPDDLLAALAEHEQRAAVLALAVRHVDATQGWAADGAVSMQAWLRDRARMSATEAGRWVRRGRFLDRFPLIANALITGELSGSQGWLLQHVTSAEVAGELAVAQQLLIDRLADLSVADGEQVCRRWRDLADAVVDAGRPPRVPAVQVSLGWASDGTLLGDLVLHERAGRELEQALATARTFEGPDDQRSMSARNADALFDVCAFFNANHHRPGTARHRPHLELSMWAHDPNGVADAEGHALHPTTAQSLTCDCVVHRITRDDTGLPLSYGRAQYTVPRHLFRALAARDGGCRFPGCDRPVRWCDAHHLRHWQHGGPTDLDNLVLLCNRHHHMVHQQHLDVRLRADHELTVTWHHGRTRTSHPRPHATAPPGG